MTYLCDGILYSISIEKIKPSSANISRSQKMLSEKGTTQNTICRLSIQMDTFVHKSIKITRRPANLMTVDATRRRNENNGAG